MCVFDIYISFIHTECSQNNIKHKANKISMLYDTIVYIVTITHNDLII